MPFVRLWMKLYYTSSANATNFSSFSMTSFSNMFVTDTDWALNDELSNPFSPSWRESNDNNFHINKSKLHEWQNATEGDIHISGPESFVLLNITGYSPECSHSWIKSNPNPK